MSYRIEFTSAAAKALSKLPRDVARRIKTAIDALADDPFPAGAVALQGAEKGSYRIRVGDYRVVYEVSRGRAVIVIVRIGDRKEVYR